MENVTVQAADSCGETAEQIGKGNTGQGSHMWLLFRSRNDEEDERRVASIRKLLAPDHSVLAQQEADLSGNGAEARSGTRQRWEEGRTRLSDEGDDGAGDSVAFEVVHVQRTSGMECTSGSHLLTHLSAV